MYAVALLFPSYLAVILKLEYGDGLFVGFQSGGVRITAMKIWVLQIATWLKSSFWFLPAILVSLGTLLAVCLVELETKVGGDWVRSLPWVFSGGAEGARGLLSSIASSMITVTGVTFSITVVALTLAAQQYTPRLLREFTADRGNQVVLGTFLATFVYSLLVLRSIRAAGFGEFIPHIAVTGAVVLVLVSVGLLIYFIHHLTASLRPDTILAGISRQAHQLIDHLFPERLGDAALDEVLPQDDASDETGMHVSVRRAGYLQALDLEQLMRLAETHDLLLRLEVRIGDFVSEGRPLLTYWPSGNPRETLQSALSACFGIGNARTTEQDLEFAVLQIVDIAVKALSPGINDPTTARTCLDYLGDLVQHLSQRHIPSPHRSDEDGRLRVIVHGTNFDRVADLAFAEIRRYSEGHVSVTTHLLRTLSCVAGAVHREDQLRVIRSHIRTTLEGAEATVKRSADLAELRLCARQALEGSGPQDQPLGIIALAS